MSADRQSPHGEAVQPSLWGGEAKRKRPTTRATPAAKVESVSGQVDVPSPPPAACPISWNASPVVSVMYVADDLESFIATGHAATFGGTVMASASGEPVPIGATRQFQRLTRSLYCKIRDQLDRVSETTLGKDDVATLGPRYEAIHAWAVAEGWV